MDNKKKFFLLIYNFNGSLIDLRARGGLIAKPIQNDKNSKTNIDSVEPAIKKFQSSMQCLSPRDRKTFKSRNGKISLKSSRYAHKRRVE